jgi:hypothetical protein
VRHHQHIDVAGLRIEVADGEGAAEIYAEKIVCEGVAQGGEECIEEGGDVAWCE